MTQEKGIPYTVTEARIAAKHQSMDIYHKELILWLCDEVEQNNPKMREIMIPLLIAVIKRISVIFNNLIPFVERT